MGIRIMDDGHSTRAVLYDSVTDWAFGPVVTECEHCDLDAVAVLEDFLAFAERREVADLRKVGRRELEALWGRFWDEHHAAPQEPQDELEGSGPTRTALRSV